MTDRRRPVPTVLVLAAAALTAGCGGSDTEAPSTSGGSAGDCGRIEVPGHVGTQVQTGGQNCDTATALVEAAVGQGRQ